MERKLITVEELQFGMFVSALDRPWTDTPFLFQGFQLTTEQELEMLKKYCKKVYVDPEKAKDLPDPRRAPPGAQSKAASVLKSIGKTVVYEELASVDQEMPRARAAQDKAEVVVKDIFSTVKLGETIDAPRAREAVSSMTDSVVRNPDAMMLLAKMREKGRKSLDRAVGVSVYMLTFGRFLQLPREQLELLGMLGLLQDVGMMRLPPELLEKKEPLTKAEVDAYEGHVAQSVAILRETAGLPADFPEIVAMHHERYDGSGYPRGLRGEAIGLYGAICGLIDCFDMLTQPEPYGEAMPPSNALNALYDWRDTRFDGPLVLQFIQCVGVYPVGAIVELNSGDTGIVIAQNPTRRVLPRVMVVLDKKGNPIKPQLILDLAREPKMNADTPYRIRRTLERSSVPIDPAEFFL